MMKQQFAISLRLDVHAVDERGHRSGSGDGLTIQDQLTISAESFMEIAAMLGRFHDLAESIKEAQAVRAEMEARGHDH